MPASLMSAHGKQRTLSLVGLGLPPLVVVITHTICQQWATAFEVSLEWHKVASALLCWGAVVYPRARWAVLAAMAVGIVWIAPHVSNTLFRRPAFLILLARTPFIVVMLSPRPVPRTAAGAGVTFVALASLAADGFIHAMSSIDEGPVWVFPGWYDVVASGMGAAWGAGMVMWRGEGGQRSEQPS